MLESMILSFWSLSNPFFLRETRGFASLHPKVGHFPVSMCSLDVPHFARSNSNRCCGLFLNASEYHTFICRQSAEDTQRENLKRDLACMPWIAGLLFDIPHRTKNLFCSFFGYVTPAITSFGSLDQPCAVYLRPVHKVEKTRSKQQRRAHAGARTERMVCTRARAQNGMQQ